MESLEYLLFGWLLCGFVVWTGLISCLLYRWRSGWLQCLVVASICYVPAVTAGAQEIFWVGLVSSVAAICAMNLMLGKHARGAEEDPINHGRPISIRNLLVLTGLIAAWVTVGTGTPWLNLEAIQSLLVLAFSCTAIPVAAMSLADSRRSRWVRWTTAGVLIVAACGLSVGLDWLYISFTAEIAAGWPPDASTFALFGPRSLKPSFAWLIITPTTLALVLIFVIWSRDARRSRHGPAIAVSLIAILPLCIVAAIISIPLTTPQQPAGENAMPDVVKLARQFGQSNFATAFASYQSAAEIPADERGALLADLEPATEQLIALSRLTMWTGIEYGGWDYLDNFSVGSFRSATRALAATAEEKLYFGGFDDAADCYIAGLALSTGIQRNGLNFHFFIGSSCQSTLTSSIHIPA